MHEEVITVDGTTEPRPLKPGWLELEVQGRGWLDGMVLDSKARAFADSRD